MKLMWFCTEIYIKYFLKLTGDTETESEYNGTTEGEDDSYGSDSSSNHNRGTAPTKRVVAKG